MHGLINKIAIGISKQGVQYLTQIRWEMENNYSLPS